MLENWPLYYKDNLWVSNLESSNAVITLWTPKELIAQELKRESFAVCGQLYSKRGINFILRNIFANPKIRNIVICGADRSESGIAFKQFMEAGIDQDGNILGVEKAVIEKEIPLEFVELFRKSVKYVNLIGSIDVKKIQETLDSFEKQNEFCEAQTFPEPELKKPNQFPSEGTTFLIRAKYIKEAWPQIVKQIMKFGEESTMLAQSKVKELVNIVTVITDEDSDNPEVTDDFDFNKKDLEIYIKNFLDPDAGSEDYNYGERIFNFKFFDDKVLHKMRKKLHKVYVTLGFKERNVLKGIDQFDMVYRKLKSFKQDRGGLITLWSTGKDNQTVKLKYRVPCLTFLQFMIRDEKLHLNAYFRSNDMFKGWPRNAFALRKLQTILAKKLKVPVGDLMSVSTLAQIYEEDWADAQNIISKYEKTAFCLPEKRSSLVIEVVDKEILVKHMSADGNNQLDEFRSNGMTYKAALKMTDILIAHNLFSNYGHAMDIGRELMKAEMCIKEGIKYVQDRDYMELSKGMSTVDVMKLYEKSS